MRRSRCIMMGTLSVVALPLLQARNWCTNADLAGSYGLAASGAIMQPEKTPITGPFVRAGRFVADGNGGLTFKTTASYNGLIFAEPYAGSYTVNQDCTVNFLIAVPAPINLPDRKSVV